MISHPCEFSLRKVDQGWFLHVITEGQVAA
jgi:hypothetical protein